MLRRKIDFGSLFAYKLYAVCTAFIDGHGCLPESNKPGLVKSLDIFDISWWRPSYLVASMETFNNYPDATNKSLVFDNKKGIPAEDYEGIP